MILHEVGDEWALTYILQNLQILTNNLSKIYNKVFHFKSSNKNIEITINKNI